MKKQKLSTLFQNMCCSKCGSDFTEDAIEVVREEDGMMVLRLVCPNCAKSFGVAFVGLSDIAVKTPFEIQDAKSPITSDDVLDAHKFIKNMDEHWQKYLP